MFAASELARVSPFRIRGLNSSAGTDNELRCNANLMTGENKFIFRCLATLLFTCTAMKEGFIKLESAWTDVLQDKDKLLHFSSKRFKLCLICASALQHIKCNVSKASPATHRESWYVWESFVGINRRARRQKRSWTATTHQDERPEKHTPHSKSVLGVISVIVSHD